MIADLKPYLKYKNSGLPWLERLPSHWNVRRSKYLFREVDQRSVTGDETRLSMSQRHGLVPSSKIEEQRLTSASNVGGKLCEAGDMVLNRLKAHLGVLALAPTQGLVSPDYTVLRPVGVANHRYFCSVYRSPYCGQELRQRAKGIVEGFWRLYTDDFYDIPVPVPPPDEQALIVRFLDWTNDRLERTIRAKRKVIVLLNEQKQAMIHRAVTRGLDPDVPLKHSGVPFIGEIPLTWQVRRLRTLVYRIEQGVSPQASGFLAAGNTWGVLKSGCVNRGVFRQTEHKQLARNFEIDPAIVVKIGDVLISRACGSPSLVGSVGRVRALDYRLILSDKIFRACFRREVDEDFMVLSMNSSYYRRQVEQSISGAEGMANNLPLSSLRDFVFAIPSHEEASEIALFVNREVQEIDVVASRLEIEIELLREYRTRLVADVVTGKLDVRVAAEQLPPSLVDDDECPVNENIDMLHNAEDDEFEDN